MARVIIGLKQCQVGIDNLDNFHFDHEELAKIFDLYMFKCFTTQID